MEGHEDVTTSRGARVIEIDAAGEQQEWRLDAGELGLTPATEEDLAPSDAERSARMTLSVLEGSASASATDLVVVNAALRIKLGGGAAEMASAIAAAREGLGSGEAMRRLEAWRRVA